MQNITKVGKLYEPHNDDDMEEREQFHWFGYYHCI